MADPRYRPKISGRNKSLYHDDDEFEEEEAKYDYQLDDDDDDDDDEDGDGDEAEEDRYSYRRRVIQEEVEEDDDNDDDDDELERHPKKRKLKNLMDYELAPRSNNSQAGVGGGSGGVRNSSQNEWTERETFALLEAWGNRYLQLGRKSLRSEDWTEVAEKVSEVSKAERLDTQCRNRLDTLKKKYKKEKLKAKEMGGSGWVYFKKMDMLMAVSMKQQCGLACGVDSGEYVFMNPKVYLNCANGFDEMRDSPSNSESGEDNEYDDDGGGGGDEGSSSFRMLADSIQKFGTIYEKIENSKRQQMMELEKMRLDFHKELELQKKQILERAQAEIEQIHEGDEEDSDASAENLSG